MTSILVVDDSAVDRRLAGGLLEKDGDFSVRYAIHGADGLEKMREELPDLVLTDLVMPELDGLELVAMVRSTYPAVPVILMTSAGNEEICVQALQRGAASYVPKRVLSQRLLDTVRQVLELASHQRTVSRLMCCLTETFCKFELDNDNKLIPRWFPICSNWPNGSSFWDGRIGCGSGSHWKNRLSMHYATATWKWGPSCAEWTTKPTTICSPIAVPAHRSATRRIFVESSLSRESAKFVIRDQGRGFDPNSLPDPTDPANLEKAAGRGVLLMRSFMDEVSYNDRGNSVTLVKRRSDHSP